MIRVPTAFGGSELAVAVDLEDEGQARVIMSVAVETGELIHSWSKAPKEPDHAYAQGDDTGPLRDRIKYLEALVENLQRQVDSIRAVDDVSITLEPSDARAIAAALVHYSWEAQR